MAIGGSPHGATRAKDGSKGAAGRFTFLMEAARGYLGALWLARDAEDRSDDGIAYVRHVAPLVAASARAAILDGARWAMGGAESDRFQLVEGRSAVDLVTPFVDGEILRTLLRTAAVKHASAEPGVLLGVVHTLVEQLKEVHERALSMKTPHGFGGVHPDSIVVDVRGRVHLLDVGAAAAASSREPWRSDPQRIGYAAPEQLEARPAVDARTDVFAVGIFLWEALANRRLFPGNDAKSARERVQKANVPRLDATRASASPAIAKEIADVVARCLERNPAARFQALSELGDAISELTPAPPERVGAWVTTLADAAITKRRQILERAAAGALTGEERLTLPPSSTRPASRAGSPATSRPPARPSSLPPAPAPRPSSMLAPKPSSEPTPAGNGAPIAARSGGTLPGPTPPPPSVRAAAPAFTSPPPSVRAVIHGVPSAAPPPPSARAVTHGVPSAAPPPPSARAVTHGVPSAAPPPPSARAVTHGVPSAAPPPPSARAAATPLPSRTSDATTTPLAGAPLPPPVAPRPPAAAAAEATPPTPAEPPPASEVPTVPENAVPEPETASPEPERAAPASGESPPRARADSAEAIDPDEEASKLDDDVEDDEPDSHDESVVSKRPPPLPHEEHPLPLAALAGASGDEPLASPIRRSQLSELTAAPSAVALPRSAVIAALVSLVALGAFVLYRHHSRAASTEPRIERTVQTPPVRIEEPLSAVPAAPPAPPATTIPAPDETAPVPAPVASSAPVTEATPPKPENVEKPPAPRPRTAAAETPHRPPPHEPTNTGFKPGGI